MEQRNRFFKGDEIEIIRPNDASFAFTVDFMTDADGNEIDVAPHPQMTVKLKPGKEVGEYAILRKRV